MNYVWKDINKAPEETVCLTNEGTAIYTRQHSWNKEKYWYLCDSSGYIPGCAEDGRSISYVTPTLYLATMDQLFGRKTRND